MIAHHVHDALRQVRRLQELVFEKQIFRGYSGKARLASGALALAGAMILASKLVPSGPRAQLTGWCVVLVLGLLINYLSLLYWFLFDPEVRRKPAMLRPALVVAPAYLVGAVLTFALVSAGQYDLLFGVWLCLYGLAQLAYRHTLPTGICLVGLGYIVCGSYWLVASRGSFLNPLPLGVVFFAGEIAGGAILILKKKADVHEVSR